MLVKFEDAGGRSAVESLRECLRATVRKSSLRQLLAGVLAASPSKSARYAASKLFKSAARGRGDGASSSRDELNFRMGNRLPYITILSRVYSTNADAFTLIVVAWPARHVADFRWKIILNIPLAVE